MHSNLVSQNMTTIEMYEKKKSIPWRYDFGKQKNFAEVFGNDRLYWLLPMHTSAHLNELDNSAGVSNYLSESAFHLPG
jgi:palmitoyltransferase